MSNNLQIYCNRRSNVELLRVVSMFLILFWHGIHHGFLQNDNLSSFGINVFNLIHWCCFWHVNAFLLISGYFGIKFKWKSCINFFMYVLFYYILLNILIPLCQGESVNLDALLYSPYTFFHGFLGWWFVKPYLFLMLLSPILELIRKVQNMQLLLIVVLLTLLNLFIGFVCKGGYNDNGFCVEHFCYMYVIGMLINRYEDKLSKYSATFIYLFIVNTIILFVFDKYLFTDDFWYGYNNPLVIINACVVFLMFIKIQIKSSIVNYVATSAFAVYLLTDHNILTRPYIVKITNVINDFFLNNVWYDLSVWIMCCVIIFAFCICFDALLRILMKHFALLIRKVVSHVTHMLNHK